MGNWSAGCHRVGGGECKIAAAAALDALLVCLIKSGKSSLIPSENLLPGDVSLK